MKQKIFVVCDLEENYAFHMAEYIMDKMPVPYTLHLFTKTKELNAFLEHNKVSILLIAQSAMSELQSNPDIPNIFILQENEEKPETDYRCINKYQDPEDVIREISDRKSVV